MFSLSPKANSKKSRSSDQVGVKVTASCVEQERSLSFYLQTKVAGFDSSLACGAIAKCLHSAPFSRIFFLASFTLSFRQLFSKKSSFSTCRLERGKNGESVEGEKICLWFWLLDSFYCRHWRPRIDCVGSAPFKTSLHTALWRRKAFLSYFIFIIFFIFCVCVWARICRGLLATQIGSVRGGTAIFA